MVREQFYGNPKNIKGVCEQFVNSDHAFELLYETVDGKDGTKHRLRAICLEKLLTTYMIGIDFMVETIS